MMSAEQPTLAVFDAVTGQVLFRRPLAQDEHSSGTAVEYFPGADHGGTQRHVDFTTRGWLPAGAKMLTGNNSHTYSDVNDNNQARTSEEVPRESGHSWNYPLTPFHLPFAKSFCDNPWPCSWNPNKPFSWKTNRAQNATQVFYFVNNWHDHLKKAPIGFTEAAGNFQQVNHGKRRQGRRRGQHPDRRRRQHRQRPARRRPHRQRQHGDAARRPQPADADVPAAPAVHVVPGRRPVLADQRRRRGRHGLPRVHPRPVQPARRRRAGPLHARRRPGRRDGRGLERLVRHGLPGRPGPAARPRRRRPTSACSIYDGAGVALDRTEPIDCKVGQTAAPSATAARPATAAATPTPTTARSSAAPRCTPTARSGRRPCGACAPRSARTGPSRW